MVVSGPVTLANVTNILQSGLTHIRQGATKLDLGGVSDLDSSLLAAILSWQRAAREGKMPFEVANVPKDLETLARLYGVDKLLSVSSGS